jgi:plastocyanin
MLLSRFLEPLYGRRARFGAVFFAVAVALAGAALLTGGASGAQKDQTIRSMGDEGFTPNVKVFSSLHFQPGKSSVASGGTLTFTHDDKTEDPHTLTIVDESDVPTTVGDVFNCGSPGTVCDEAFQAFPPGPPASGFVNGPGTGDGIDGRLDSLFIFPGESASAPVTAEPGTTLHFMCAIHAWMQGTIEVK